MNETKKGGRWRGIAWPLLILLAAGAVVALLVATRPKTHPVKVAEKAWPVAVVTARPGRWSPTLTLYGKVEALVRTILVSPLAAEVVQVKAEEGQRVQKGQLLVALDDRDYRLDLQRNEAEVAQAEAAIAEENSRHQGNLQALPSEKRLLQLAQAEVNRLRGLIGRKLASQSKLDNARQALARQSIAVARIEESIRTHQSKLHALEARLAQARAALGKARLQLARAQVRAPENSRVLAVKVAVGQRVSPGAPLVELFGDDKTVLRAVVPEPYLAVLQRQLDAGKTVTAQAKMDGRVVNARLIRLAAAVSQDGAGVAALFRLQGRRPWLQLGRVLRLRVSLPPVDGVVPLPWEALYGADRVYLVDEHNRLHGVRVEKVGRLRDDNGERLLVRLPKSVGGRILATQLPNAVEGLLVKVTRSD